MDSEKAVEVIKLKSSAKYQYLAAIIVNLLTITYGISCGWPTPMMGVLESDETPLPSGKLTLDETSWIASNVCFGGLIGNLLFGFTMNIYGRKKSLLFMTLPSIVGWLLMLFAENVYYLYGTRVLCGLVGGGVFVITPTYLSEIANDKVRGALASTLVLSCNVGISIGFTLGYYCNFSLTPQIAILLTVAFVILFFFLPETPLFLVKKDRISEAERSIRFYSDLNNNQPESIETVQMEIKKLKSVCNDATAKQAASSLTWSDFTAVEARKAFIIGIVLVVVNQFSGVFAMLTYTDTILKEANTSISPATSAIMISIIQLIGSYVPTVLSDRAGRKFLLLMSALGTAVGMCVMATYSLLKPSDPSVAPWASYIPVFTLAFIIFIGGCGVVSMPFGVIAEVLPEKLKSFGISFLMEVLWLLCLIVLKYLPFMMKAIGLHGAAFFFAGICVACSIFMIIFMPETKGKSYEEIMASLR